MRQYKIHFRRAGSAPDTGWVTLRPFDHHGLYSKLEVEHAVEHLRANPFVRGMLVVVEDDMFNIIAYTKPTLDPDAFKLDKDPPTAPAV